MLFKKKKSRVEAHEYFGGKKVREQHRRKAEKYGPEMFMVDGFQGQEEHKRTLKRL